jgi:4-hydroxybenzoate polyprenyltransferase/phosphoserine phosphatase
VSANPSLREPVTRAAPAGRIPLCVDLDGTLLSTDLLVEALIRFLKPNPLRVLLVLAWALRGPARLKAELAARVALRSDTLPVHEQFVDWLRNQKREGRRLVVCTAANERVAAAVAARFGIFDEVIASSATVNLSGRAKAHALVSRYGLHGFDYAANEHKDIHVWRQARSAIVVAPRKLLRHVAAEPIQIERSFEIDSHAPRDWVRALRLHQWAKNLLLFAPLAASHRLHEPGALAACLIAFLLFGLCASGGYLVNDLLDLDADRAHPRKKERPFAAGRLPLLHGMMVAAVLIVGALALAWLVLPAAFALCVLFYLAMTFWYSLALKRIAMVDVLSLAGLYTVRVVAGGAAVAVVPSFWLLAFSMFLFLSLAAAKRYAELRSMLDAGRNTAAGRGYSVEDLPLLHASGTAAGYLAVLVLALYVNSGAALLYATPQLMWLLCPLLLYWINRIWLKTFRGQMHDDPVVFALTDRPSVLVFAASAVLVWAASQVALQRLL